MKAISKTEQKVKFWANLFTILLVVAGLFYCINGMFTQINRHF